MIIEFVEITCAVGFAARMSQNTFLIVMTGVMAFETLMYMTYLLTRPMVTQ